MTEPIELILAHGWQVGVAAIVLLMAVLFLREWVKKLAHSSFEEDLAKAREEFRARTEGTLEKLRAENRARENLQMVAMGNFAASHGASQERRLEAISIAWAAIRKLHDSIPWYIWTVDIVGYREEKFGRKLIPLLKEANYAKILEPTGEVDKSVVMQRPFLGDSLYALYRSYAAFIGRAVGTMISFRSGTFRSWLHEEDTLLLIRDTLSAEELKDFEALESEQLTWLCRKIEEKFISGASPIIVGDASATETVALAERVFGEAQSVVRKSMANLDE